MTHTPRLSRHVCRLPVACILVSLACALLLGGCAKPRLMESINGAWDMEDGTVAVFDLSDHGGTMTHIRPRTGKKSRRDVTVIESAHYDERSGVARLVTETTCAGTLLVCFRMFMEMRVESDTLLVRGRIDGWDNPEYEDLTLTRSAKPEPGE